MDFKSVRKRIMAAKKPRAKSAPMRARIERTVGIVLVVLMGAAAIMLAARKPEAVASPAMTSKVVAPEESPAPSVQKASMSHTDTKGSAPKHGNGNAVIASPVTITGCLEQDHDVFRLKDTDGAEAPQSRSWKSGFLKKRNATITVLDGSSAHRLKLDKHVGERVSVTGPLADKELTARSLARVAASCE